MKRPVIEVFLQHVQITTSCWLWTGFVSTTGYGHFCPADGGYVKKGAHVVAYELFVGPVPPDMEVDHLCHNADHDCKGGNSCLHRRCVNPDHLQPVCRLTNMQRSFRRIYPDPRYCTHGHVWDENTVLESNGAGKPRARRCRACINKKQMKRYYARKVVAWG